LDSLWSYSINRKNVTSSKRSISEESEESDEEKEYKLSLEITKDTSIKEIIGCITEITMQDKEIYNKKTYYRGKIIYPDNWRRYKKSIPIDIQHRQYERRRNYEYFNETTKFSGVKNVEILKGEFNNIANITFYNESDAKNLLEIKHDKE